VQEAKYKYISHKKLLPVGKIALAFLDRTKALQMPRSLFCLISFIQNIINHLKAKHRCIFL